MLSTPNSDLRADFSPSSGSNIPAAYSTPPMAPECQQLPALRTKSKPLPTPETPRSLALLPSGSHLTPPRLPHALCSSHPGLWRSSVTPGCSASGPSHMLSPLPGTGASGFCRQEVIHTWFLSLSLAQVQFSYSVGFKSTPHWPPWKLVWVRGMW